MKFRKSPSSSMLSSGSRREAPTMFPGIKGERYPCKNDIFLATYEPA